MDPKAPKSLKTHNRKISDIKTYWVLEKIIKIAFLIGFSQH